MRILVAFGPEGDGTAPLARAVGDALAAAGHQADVRAVRGLRELVTWDAVLVGGTLTADGLPGEIRRFVRRNVDVLRAMPVWFFTCGAAVPRPFPAVPARETQVRALMNAVGARGHGSVRGDGEARAWAAAVGDALAAAPAPPRLAVRRARALRRTRRALVLLCAVSAVIAFAEGGELVLWHRLLFNVAIGGLGAVAAVLLARGARIAESVALVAGLALVIWIATEMARTQVLAWPHAIFLGVGVATCALAARLLTEHARTLPPRRAARAA